jgi:hypothetical protein
MCFGFVKERLASLNTSQAYVFGGKPSLFVAGASCFIQRELVDNGIGITWVENRITDRNALIQTTHICSVVLRVATRHVLNATGFLNPKIVFSFPVPVCDITASGVPGGTFVSMNHFSTLCGWLAQRQGWRVKGWIWPSEQPKSAKANFWLYYQMGDRKW